MPNGRNIAVNHTYLGKGLTPGRIGPMSMEMCIWLDARIGFQTFLSANPDQEIAQRMFSGHFAGEHHEWDIRCRLAGSRGYEPSPLCEPSGTLTPYGYEIAFLCQSHIQDNMDIIGIHPEILDEEKWTKTVDVFLMGGLTKRQASMLKLLYFAIIDAERTNRLELDERFQSYRKQQELKADTNVGLEFLPDLVSASGTVDLFAERDARNVSQDFQAIMYGAENTTRKAFVPTAMFGQKARTDLNTLIKYGLVDMRAYVSGVRGRPKHVVRVSPPGAVVVNDLMLQELI